MRARQTVHDLRARRHATYMRVAECFESFDPTWSMVSAGFVRSGTVTIDGKRWTVSLRIDAYHVDRDLSKQPRLRSSITLWPPRSANGKKTAAERKWAQAAEQEIRRHGYEGEWRRSPAGGRFGDFWKSLRNAKGVAAEVRRLNDLNLQPRTE